MADKASELLEFYGQIPVSNVTVNTIPAMRLPPQGIEKYAREGIDLDVTSGAPFGTRAGLSFAKTAEAKIARLQNAFSGSQVEATPEGHLIVRNVLDESTGRTKDLLVDEQDVTLGDVADLTKAGFQTLAEIFVLRGFGRARGMLANVTDKMGRPGRLVSESAVGAGTSETVSGLGEAIQGYADTGEVEGGRILRESIGSAAVGTGLGIGLGGAVEGFASLKDAKQGKVVGLFSPGDDEQKGIRALDDILFQTGIDIEPTLGQMAKDENALRLESYMSRIPVLGRMFTAQMERQEESIRALQRKLIGQEQLQPMADLGADMVETIRPFVDQPRQAAESVKQSIVLRAADQLEDAITKIAPTARPLTTEGTAVLTKLTARNQHDKFREVANILFTDVGNPEISTKPLKGLLAEVQANLPKKTVVNESDLANLAGQPLATTEGKEIVRELVPSELLRFLKGLESLDETMPLSELRRIRNTVDDAIREGRGLEGVSTRELKQIQHALTETIEKGVEGAPDDVAEKLTAANSFYRENIERFEVPFISRLLKETPDKPGHIGNFELLDTIRSNPDRFREIEQFLTTGITKGGRLVSEQNTKIFNLVRRSLMEDIFSKSRISPTGPAIIDPKKFASELEGFKPAVRASLLGAKEEVVTKNIELLKKVEEGYQDVAQDQLEAFIRTPGNSVHDLSRLVTARRRDREVFENEVIKKLFKGEIDSSQIRADQALDWMLNAKNDADVAQVMALLGDNPSVQESLRRNTVASFFQEVRRKTTSADATRQDPSHLVDPRKLIDSLRDPQTRSRLRLIVGDDNFQVLNNFATAQAVLGKKSGQTLEGTNAATKILTNVSTLLKDVPQLLRLTFYAVVLTNKGLQRMVREGSLDPATDVRELTTALVASAPMLDALSQELGKSGAEMAIQIFRDALGVVRPEEGLQMRGKGEAAPARAQSQIPASAADDLLQLVQ